MKRNLFGAVAAALAILAPFAGGAQSLAERVDFGEAGTKESRPLSGPLAGRPLGGTPSGAAGTSGGGAGGTIAAPGSASGMGAGRVLGIAAALLTGGDGDGPTSTTSTTSTNGTN